MCNLKLIFPIIPSFGNTSISCSESSVHSTHSSLFSSDSAVKRKMSTGVAIAAAVVTALALVLGIVATFIPYWEVNDPSTTTKDNIVRHVGLWLQCTSYSTGNWECDDYNTFFAALSTKIQAARGLTLSALILGVAALAIMANAVCTSACKPLGSLVYLLAAAGLITLLAGACMIAAPSWYAKDLYDEYYFLLYRAGGNIQNAGRVMVFGSALFIAWASGALFILGAVLAFGALCCTTDDTREPYTYRGDRINTVNKSMTEYV